MKRPILFVVSLALVGLLGCLRSPKTSPCPVAIAEPVRVVPGSPHCLTQPPPKVPAIVDEISKVEPGEPASRKMQDELADYTIAVTKYAFRAWRLCGTVPQ